MAGAGQSAGMAAFQVETVPRGKTLEKMGDHAQATLKQTKQAMTESLARFKTMVEKTSAGQ